MENMTHVSNSFATCGGNHERTIVMCGIANLVENVEQRKFVKILDLKQHQNEAVETSMHSSIPMLTYTCTICGKVFKRRSSLWNHKKIHSANRPYGCNLCGKRFKWKNCLLVHAKLHLKRNEISSLDAIPDLKKLLRQLQSKQDDRSPSTQNDQTTNADCKKRCPNAELKRNVHGNFGSSSSGSNMFPINVKIKLKCVQDFAKRSASSGIFNQWKRREQTGPNLHVPESLFKYADANDKSSPLAKENLISMTRNVSRESNDFGTELKNPCQRPMNVVIDDEHVSTESRLDMYNRSGVTEQPLKFVKVKREAEHHESNVTVDYQKFYISHGVGNVRKEQFGSDLPNARFVRVVFPNPGPNAIHSSNEVLNHGHIRQFRQPTFLNHYAPYQPSAGSYCHRFFGGHLPQPNAIRNHGPLAAMCGKTYQFQNGLRHSFTGPPIQTRMRPGYSSVIRDIRNDSAHCSTSLEQVECRFRTNYEPSYFVKHTNLSFSERRVFMAAQEESLVHTSTCDVAVQTEADRMATPFYK